MSRERGTGRGSRDRSSHHRHPRIGRTSPALHLPPDPRARRTEQLPGNGESARPDKSHDANTTPARRCRNPTIVSVSGRATPRVICGRGRDWEIDHGRRPSGARTGPLRVVVRLAARPGLRERHDGDPLEEPVADASGLDPSELGERKVHPGAVRTVQRLRRHSSPRALAFLGRAQGDLHDLVFAQLANPSQST